MPNLDTDAITAKEAGEVLGKNRRQVLRLVSTGQLIPALKLPGDTGAYLFNRADIEALLTEGTDRRTS